MLKVIQIIAGWFVSGGAISSFFAWLGVKFISKTAIVSMQVVHISVLFLAHAAFLYAVLELFKTIFNALNIFLKDLPTLLTTSGDLLSLGYQLMQAVGLIDALMDAFSLFNTLIVAIFGAWTLKLIFNMTQTLSNEFFKLGVLIQE